MKRKLRINGHSHLLPYPEEIPQFMKDNGIFWVDKDRNFMLQKNWKRPVTDSSFFLNEKIYSYCNCSCIFKSAIYTSPKIKKRSKTTTGKY